MSIELPRDVCTRMAPTPSGYLHMGNMLNFLFTWLIARATDGTIHLRIDDLDQARFRPEYLEDIFESLDWWGLDWDEGPSGPEQLLDSYSQQYNLEEYHAILEYLGKANAVFACAKSRKEIQAESSDGQYPFAFREQGLSLEKAGVAWRLLVPDPCLIEWEDVLMGKQNIDLFRVMRDFVVKRRDGVPAYQVASVVDDEANEINLVVRGEDLLLSSAAQLYLAQQLKFELFPAVTFLHHPLLTGKGGEKLSKSDGAMSMRQLRQGGMQIERVLGFAAKVLGLPTYPYSSAEELWDEFDPNNLQWHPVLFSAI